MRDEIARVIKRSAEIRREATMRMRASREEQIPTLVSFAQLEVPASFMASMETSARPS